MSLGRQKYLIGPTPVRAHMGVCPDRRATTLAIGMACGLAIFGCAKPPTPPKPKALVLDMQATSSVNPDARGRPSPVVVRIYELRSAAPFETADFVSLYEKDQSVLGAEIVARDEFVLSPGDSKSIRRETGESKFLAVMAAFRDLERARWRVVSPLLTGSDNAFAITLDGSTLTVTKR